MPAARKERQRQEREAYELERLNSIRGYIDYLVFVYSRDVPDQAEDIAQESRLRVIEVLKQEPDCPISYLKRAAKEGIWQYRNRGRSVDGKINASLRVRQYNASSLDEPLTEDGSTLQEVLSETSYIRRTAEESAFHQVLMEELRSQLSAEENQIVSMRLEGADWQEVAGVFGYRAGRPGPVRERLKEVVKGIFSPEVRTNNDSQSGLKGTFEQEVADRKGLRGK